MSVGVEVKPYYSEGGESHMKGLIIEPILVSFFSCSG